MTTITETAMDKAARLLPYAITAVVIIMCWVHRLIVGGFEPTNWLIALKGLSAPFAVSISVIVLIRSQILRFMRRKEIMDTVGPVLFFIVFLWTVGLTFTVGTRHEAYLVTADVLFTHAFLSNFMISGLTLTMLTIRDLRPKNPAFVYMIFLVIIAFMAITPLGDLISPIFIDVAFWFLMNPSAVGDQVMYIGIYVATLLLVVRMLFNKEKVRAA